MAVYTVLAADVITWFLEPRIKSFSFKCLLLLVYDLALSGSILLIIHCLNQHKIE